METGAQPLRSAAPAPVRSEGQVVDRLAFTVTMERLFTMLRRITPVDLSLTTVSALHALDRDGPHRLSDLAAGEGVTQPGMTQLVSRLERDGLAERCTDPSDGRVVIVRITGAGRDLLHQRRQQRADQLADLLAGLEPGDEAAIAAALPALTRLAALPAHTRSAPPAPAGTTAPPAPAGTDPPARAGTTAPPVHAGIAAQPAADRESTTTDPERRGASR